MTEELRIHFRKIRRTFEGLTKTEFLKAKPEANHANAHPMYSVQMEWDACLVKLHL